MVKKSKVLIFLKKITFLVLVLNFFGCSKYFKVNNEDFKVLQKKVKLFPLNTLGVLGLNTALVKNGDNLYLVTLSVRTKKYKWLIDTIKIKKSLGTDFDSSVALKDIPINLYLSQDIEFLLQFKKINSTYMDQDTVKQPPVVIEIPYFIILNNKLNDNIYFFSTSLVKVNLSDNKPVKFSRNIKIKFSEKYLDKLEFLVGFKLTLESYSNLLKYINQSSATY